MGGPLSPITGVRAIFFDVGETLVDETRQWAEWADWLTVPHLTFFGVLGGLIERGEDHRRVFDIVRPGLDLQAERERRAMSGRPDAFTAMDLYPDAVPCLHECRRRGYLIGLAGNQPAEAEQTLSAMGLPVQFIASSSGWGVAKPSPAFFRKITELTDLPAGQIAYVGDRLDNDVLPALESGMTAVFLRRGPWGYLHALRPQAARAHIRLDSLLDLPETLAALERGRE